jgi:hypothetical protein
MSNERNLQPISATLSAPQTPRSRVKFDLAQYSNSHTPTPLFEHEDEDDFDAPGEGGKFDR